MPVFKGIDGIDQCIAVQKRALDDATTVYDGGCTCGFRTLGWPRKKDAQARINEHRAEHQSGEPVRELVVVNKSVGLTGPIRKAADIPIFDDDDDEEEEDDD